MLLGLIVAISLILLALSVAATKVAFELRREREVESARRADQYVRAIRRFYLKNQHYPGSIEQLEKTNNIRYLRQKYVDPLKGQDYRLILVGQNKTTVKGFFGQPLAGIASAGLGSAAGLTSAGLGGAATPAAPGGAGAAGAAGTGATGTGATGTGATGAAGASGTTGAAGAPGGTGTTNPAGSASPFGSSSGFGTGLPGSGAGPFMGVGSNASGNSIIEPNEQTTYETWEFLYDPRVELLRAKSALNAGAGSAGAGTLGSSGFGSSTTPTGTTPTGTSGTQPTKP
ncbi:MAG TPA: type II secretion system protein [Acidobacteriaceae bacterium]